MDIYEYLKLDHEEVNKLFKQFENSEVKERQEQIVSFLTDLLLAHARAEQETFYKALEHHLNSRDKALHGRKEHEEMEQQIKRILETKNKNSHWHEQVKKLKDLVTHHVNEEEGTLFRKAKEVLSEEQAYRLKEQMHYLKENILLRGEEVSLA